MLSFDPEQFLKDIYNAMNIDTSELSPFTRYVLTPIVESYNHVLQEQTEVWQKISNAVNNKLSRSEIPQEVMNFLLNLLGIDSLHKVYTTAVVHLVPSAKASDALRFLSRSYEDGEIQFNYGAYTFSCKPFVATVNPDGRPFAVAEFFAEPEATIPVGTTVYLNHDDFDSGTVISVTQGYYNNDPKELFDLLKERLYMPSFAGNKRDWQILISTLLKTKKITIIGAGDPLMFADLIQVNPPKHLGGIVDVYAPLETATISSVTMSTISYSTVMHREVEFHPYITFAPQTVKLPVDDTNISKTFLASKIGTNTILKPDTVLVLLENMPILDVVNVYYRGKKLIENQDYALLSLTRAYTFSPRNIIAVVFNNIPAQDTVTITYTTAHSKTLEDQLNQMKYISSTIQLKAFAPVWITGDVTWTGNVDFTELQKQLFELEEIDESVFISLMKKCGAQSVSVSSLKARLISMGFGTFERALPCSLNDFSIILPSNVLGFYTSQYHLSKGR